MFRTRPTRRRAPSIEALEPRLLFSADPVGATDAAAAAWTAAISTEATAWQAQPAADLNAAQTDGARGAAPRELALVDVRVPDVARLLAELEGQRDAGRPIDVLVVGEGDDAIAVLDAALSGASGPYGAVHLFGHGEPGSMQLGAGSLDLATLRMRAGEVAGWSHGLTDGADLLLWGCDAGSGPAGAALLDALSALTGADVAASTDTTGGLAAGGNWVLEAARGSIEATVPIGAALRIEFAGSLALAPILEVPVAAFSIGALAVESDFLVLAIDDLQAYLLAADRDNSAVREYHELAHPAVFEFLARIAKEADRLEKEVVLFGESAADPQRMPFYIGAGFRRVSIAPVRLRKLLKVLRRYSADECRRIAARVLEAPRAVDVQRVLVNVETD